MKEIKVLGSGCKKCSVTAQAIEKAATAAGIEIALEKIEDFPTIASYGVMGTPSVVVDGVVVHTGSVPKPAQIASWLA